MHNCSPEEPPDTSYARTHAIRTSNPLSDATTPSSHSTHSEFTRCTPPCSAMSRHMNDIVHRGPACLRVLALLPRTRAIAWHHGDMPNLMLTVCFTMWCICLSTPSHSVSTNAVVRVDRLNSHAHSSMPAT
eukprot:4800534-Pleurochrysis_carterae.AAC.1